MSGDGSARSVLTALGANLGVAVAKFVAAGITGSVSLLAEGVHSVADSGNQVLLLVGGRRSRRAPSELHPFGYARRRYIYAFLVAVVLFTLGGLYALYEGYHKILDPHPLSSPLVADGPLTALIVLGIIIAIMQLEGHVLQPLLLGRAVKLHPLAVVLVIIIAVMQLEGHVLQPLLLGRAVKLHPLAVVLAIAAGLVVAGIAGALFAVPLLAVLNSGIRSLLSAADEHVDPDDVHTSSPEETGPDEPGLDRQPELSDEAPAGR